MPDLLKEGVMVATISPFNSPVWPVFKAAKNEWRLTVSYNNLNVVVSLIKVLMFY